VLGDSKVLIERHMLSFAPTLQVEPGASIVGESVSHQLRANPKEMRAVLPIGFPEVAQLQVDFANESRVLKDMVAILPGHVGSRQAMQFAIDKGSQPVERVVVAVAPRTQQRCDAD